MNIPFRHLINQASLRGVVESVKVQFDKGIPRFFVVFLFGGIAFLLLLAVQYGGPSQA